MSGDNKDYRNTNPDKKRPVDIQKIIFFAVLAAFLAAVAAAVVITINAGGIRRVQSSYEDSKHDAIEEIHEDMHDAAEVIAETIYHIENRAQIEIGDIKNCSNLEVLRVRESSLNLVNGSNELTEVTSWIEVTETCEYTVDLTKADFQVDNEKESVTVKVPEPIASGFTIENYDQLFSNASIFSGSASDGQELIDRQVKEADEEIRARVSENKQYQEMAQKAARTIIVNAITALNADIEDLSVTVDFYK